MFFLNNALNRIVLSLLFLSFFFAGLAQESSNYNRSQFIEDFKQATLLVRLQDKALSLKALEDKGKSKEAERLRQIQYQENREILLSFKNTFDFCPVLFFYSSNSEAIRKGNYEGILFDAELKASDLKTENVFIAEFAETEELGIDGLIVKDKQMLALPEQLPYFERRYVLLGMIERSKARMIEAYNHKLSEYWEMERN